MAGFTCCHCERWYRHEKNLRRHVDNIHTNQPLFSCNQCGRSFNRADNLQTYVHNCTGRGVAVPATKKRCTGVAPEIFQFKLQNTREALEGSVQQFTGSIKEAKSL